MSHCAAPTSDFRHACRWRGCLSHRLCRMQQLWQQPIPQQRCLPPGHRCVTALTSQTPWSPAWLTSRPAICGPATWMAASGCGAWWMAAGWLHPWACIPALWPLWRWTQSMWAHQIQLQVGAGVALLEARMNAAHVWRPPGLHQTVATCSLLACVLMAEPQTLYGTWRRCCC